MKLKVEDDIYEIKSIINYVNCIDIDNNYQKTKIYLFIQNKKLIYYQ